MTDLTKIPVTVITGFLGAGKTTLIRHLMQNPQGKRLAILVNEFGTVRVDGDAVYTLLFGIELEPSFFFPPYTDGRWIGAPP